MKQMAFALLLTAHFASVATAQKSVEQFDVAGLPARPTTFLEQQIAEMIRGYRRGDLASASQIQRKLASYYSQVGDTARARVALERADNAEHRTDRSAPPGIGHQPLCV